MKKFFALLFLSVLVTACSSSDVEYDYPEKVSKRDYARGKDKEKKKLFGDEGITIGGEEDGANGGSSIGVNSFLWRATLDTISFMPIASADPFGGVVITDWYSAPDAKDIQFKVNVFIMSGALRADGVKVTAFKKEKKDGEWVDVTVDNETLSKMEDAILTRARELKHATMK